MPYAVFANVTKLFIADLRVRVVNFHFDFALVVFHRSLFLLCPPLFKYKVIITKSEGKLAGKKIYGAVDRVLETH